MAIIVGTFAICWMPFAVMFMLIPTCDSAADFFIMTEEGNNAIEWITWIGKIETLVGSYLDSSILGYLNSSLNPIIYVFMNPGFRNAITNMFKRK